MSVLDTIQSRKDELIRLRQTNGVEYLKRMASGIDQLNDLLEPQMAKEGPSATVEGEKQQARNILWQKKPEALLSSLAESSRLGVDQLKAINFQLIRESGEQAKARLKEWARSKKPPVAVGATSSGSVLGSVADLASNATGGGKWGKVLGRAGGALAVGMGGYNAISALSDDKMSDNEKATKVGGGVGMAIGGAVGMLGGPLGAMIGAQVGEMVGSAVGEPAMEAYRGFTQYMHNDLGPTVTKTMDTVGSSISATTQSIGDRFATLGAQAGDVFRGLGEAKDSIVNGFKVGWSEMGKGGEEAFAKLKDSFLAGDGLLGGLKNVFKSVPAAFSSFRGGAENAAAAVKSGAVNAASNVGEAIKTASMTGRAAENWQKNGSAITDAALRYGIDPKQFAKTMYAESKFENSAKAGTSSASGMGQFLDSTWVDTVAKHGKSNKETEGLADMANYAKSTYGGKNGFNKDGARADPKLAALFAAKEDVTQSSLMTAAFTKDNIKMLEKGGVSNPNAAEMYSAHFLGNSKLAATARQNPDMTVDQMLSSGVIRQQEIDANKSVFSGKGTAKDVMAELGKRVDLGNSYGDAATLMASKATVNLAGQKSPTVIPTVTAMAVTPATVSVPGQPGVSSPVGVQSKSFQPVSAPSSVKIAQEVPTSAKVDKNPVRPTETVAVSNIPEPAPVTVASSSPSSTSGSGVPKLSEIPIHITDQGLVLIQVGIV
jgi:hypothetical protein